MNGGVAALFLGFAGVQINDPDPLRWIVLYTLAAGYCALAAAGFRIPPGPVVAYGLLTGGLGVWTLVRSPDLGQPMGDPSWGALADEGVREALGLFLVTGWMWVLGVWTALTRSAAKGGEG